MVLGQWLPAEGCDPNIENCQEGHVSRSDCIGRQYEITAGRVGNQYITLLELN